MRRLTSRRGGWRVLREAVAGERAVLVRGTVVGITWQAAGALAPLVLARAIDDGLVGEDRGALATWAAVLVLLGVLQAGTSLLRHRYAVTAFACAEDVLRRRLLARVHELDAAATETMTVGGLLSRATSDVRQVGNLVDCVAHTVGYAVSVVLVAGLLATLDVPLALLVLASMGVMSVVVAACAGELRRRSGDQQAAVGQVTEVAEQTVSGFAALVGLGAGPAVLVRGQRAADQARAAGVRSARWESGLTATLALVPSLALALVLLVGGRRLLAGELTLGTLLAAVTYVGFLVPALRTLGARVATVQRALASADRIAEVLSARSTVGPDRDPCPVPVAKRGLAVTLRGVTASRAGRPVLRELDLHLPAGSRTALVGATGSGKTTLAMLLTRERDPDAGRVTAGGIDLRRLVRAELRAAVTVCGHDPVLFRGTLREAVTFARPDADETAVARALWLAAAEDVVTGLPDGLDTLIGDRGRTLSGGQRQRVALARAILSDPAVLVLDDVTSALDPATEATVTDRLATAVPCTLLVVTHRTAPLRLVDRVLLLDGGRIVADGRHDELLAGCARYREVLAIDSRAGAP